MLSALRQHGARHHHGMRSVRPFGPQIRPVRVQTAGSRLRSPSVKVCCYIQEGTAAEGKATAAPARAGSVTRAPSSSPAAASAASRPPVSWRRPYSPGPLTEAEFEQYWDQGYVIKRGLLTQDDINPCLQAIDRRVDEVAQRLLSAGLISDPVADVDVFHRLALLEKQFAEASTLVHKDGRLPPEFATLWSHPLFISINRQLLGPDVDIAGHPSWNLRAKAPRQEAANLPWHQDSAYCGREAWDTLQVTAWVPMLDVNVDNGCLQLLAGGHRAGRIVQHTGGVGNTWYLQMDADAAVSELGVDFSRDLVTAEMKTGDVLLFNNHLPHRALDNNSNLVRWSLDLRWQDAAQPEGNFGLKKAIVMSKAADPDHAIDWASWANLDKKSGSADGLKAVDEAAGVDPELSTILTGDWIGLWPVVNSNRHTQAWDAFKRAQQQQQEQQQQ